MVIEAGVVRLRSRLLRRGARSPRLAASLLVVTAVLTAGVALLVRHGALLVHQCLPGHGAAGWLGLRLALLRSDAGCPDGTLAVGGDGRQVMGVVITVALPVLLAHLAGAGIGLGLLGGLGRAVRVAGTLLAAVARRLPSPRRVVVPARRALVAATPTAIVTDVVGHAFSRRGPPVARLA